MRSSLPARAYRYCIYLMRRSWQYVIYTIRRLIVCIVGYVAWKWSWLTMNARLQEVVAERNAAIRLAMDAQTTVYRLQEQVTMLQATAASGSLERELADLSRQITLQRRLLNNAQSNSGEDEFAWKCRHLDAIETAHKNLLQEIDSWRRRIENMRSNLNSTRTDDSLRR